MAINSINNYVDSMSTLATALSQQVNTNNTTTQSEDTSIISDQDSYVSTFGDAGAVYSSNTYNDILALVAQIRASSAETTTVENTVATTESTESEGGVAGSAGSSSDSEIEEETTTEIVRIDGVTYLQTTTVTDGISTVTRTVLSDSKEPDDNQESKEQITREQLTNKE